MMDRNEPWREDLATAWNELVAQHSDHPGEETLGEYHRGRLDESEQDRVEAHLSECAECLQALVDLRDFLQSVREIDESASEGAQDRDFEVFWQRLQPEDARVSDAPGPGRIMWWNNPRLLFTLAAGLLLAFALTAIWGVTLWQENRQLTQRQPQQGDRAQSFEEVKEENNRLRERIEASQQQAETLQEENRRLQDRLHQTEQSHETELAQLMQPEMNVPIRNIYPRDDTERSGGSGSLNRIHVPSGTRALTLILSDYKPGYEVYRLEIVDRTGRVIWSGGGLRPDQAGDLTLKLDRAFLPQRNYTLNLYGAGELVAQYLIVIE